MRPAVADPEPIARVRAEIERRIGMLGLEGNIVLAGSMTQAETAALYRTAALHVNVSATGSMDKTVMEALACGCPVLTSNEAFFDTLKAFPTMRLAEPTPESLAERMADRHGISNITFARADILGLADSVARVRETVGRPVRQYGVVRVEPGKGR